MASMPDDLDNLMGLLGDFGKYQLWQFILHILAAVTAGMHMLSLVTVAAIPEHRCFIPEIDNSTAANLIQNPYINGEINDTLYSYIPQTPSGSLASCYRYSSPVYPDLSNFTESNWSSLVSNVSSLELDQNLTECSSWVYDTTYHVSSRAIEWDFVCDRRWMAAIAQSTYMFGVFVGAVTLGGLADKVGRKKVFCWSALLQLILGVLVAFIPEYFTFLVVRFFYGVFGSAGSYITGFVLTMEIVGPSKRTICGIMFQVAFAVGIMLDAMWATFITDRTTLQAIYGLHGLLLVAHWWIMDESPRWLWSQGRIKESVDIIANGVQINGRGIPVDKDHFIASGNSTKVKKEDKVIVNASDLFKTPNLRKKTLNVGLCWFANSIVYYGLSLSTGKLQGNPFLLMFLMALVEMPSYVITVLLLDKLGRRSLISSMMLAGGICCITGAHMVQGAIATTGVVLLGKFFIAGSFAIIYNYSAELFPTVLRNTALGIGAMCARLAGTVTPLITLLDSFDATLPAVIFGVISLMSGFLTLFLPETMGQPMPQSIEDGENFGDGDTCFSTGFKKKGKQNDVVLDGINNKF